MHFSIQLHVHGYMWVGVGGCVCDGVCVGGGGVPGAQNTERRTDLSKRRHMLYRTKTKTYRVSGWVDGGQIVIQTAAMVAHQGGKIECGHDFLCQFDTPLDTVSAISLAPEKSRNF